MTSDDGGDKENPSDRDDGDTTDTSSDALLRQVAHVSDVEAPRSTPPRFAHFRVQQRLGRGGMGIVYRAVDESLGRLVALKVLPPALEDDGPRRRRLMREARAAAAVTHPNIATVYEVGEAEGRVYIAMELVEGKSLRARLTDWDLPLAETVKLALQIAAGLARAHKAGIVHRDLKPDNVVVTDDGIAKILDFGLAKLVLAEPSNDGDIGHMETMTEDRNILGTPAYMSPEQARGEAVTAATDVFAFGVTLHEMVTGGRPFSVTPAHNAAHLVAESAFDRKARRPELPPLLERAIERCLMTDARERIADGAALVRALEEAATEVATWVPKLPVTPRSSGPPAPREREAPTRVEGADHGATPLVQVAAGERAPRRRGWWLGAAFAVIATAMVVITSRVPSTTRVVATNAASSSAAPSARPRPIGLLDHPPPVTKNPEAAQAYRRALSDLRDAARAPQLGFLRALELDPEMAAASLRAAMFMGQPASKEQYRNAVRLRDSLDARDRDLLHAEEPIGMRTPPDFREATRRYRILHEARPLDMEVLLRLATIEGEHDRKAARATMESLVALDPTMPGAELAAATNAEQSDDVESARRHYLACMTLSSLAALCVVRQARLLAKEGRCDLYAKEITRALTLEPTDFFFRRAGVAAVLSAGGTDDELRAAVANALVIDSTAVAKSHGEELSGAVALWQGAFDKARDALMRADEAARLEGFASTISWVFPERLAIAEELGDELAVAAMARGYVGARGLTTEGDHDGLVLRALRSHHVLPEDAVRTLRARWRADSADRVPWQVWLEYDGEPAVTNAEARDALGLVEASEAPHALSPVNASLGRLLLLAGRPADAAARLERVARDCALLDGDHSLVHVAVQATYALGMAHEAMGDRAAACADYRRVIQRWGGAKPRSTTGAAARLRSQTISCSE